MFRPPQPTSMHLNLAPMVDVFMCLIIFFLLAAKLVSAEHAPLSLPWAVAAREVAVRELGERVTINVRRSVQRREAIEYVVVDWDGRQVVERVLPPSELEKLLRARAAAAAAQKQNLRCVIRAEQAVHYRYIETVLRACGLAKVSHVVFGVNKGTEPADGEQR
jgi:biopolymer transport protein ExbD